MYKARPSDTVAGLFPSTSFMEFYGLDELPKLPVLMLIKEGTVEYFQ